MEATVKTPSPQMEELSKKRFIVKSIMGGTDVMRMERSLIPQHPAEKDAIYEQRVKKAFLDNFVSDAIEETNGKLFAKEIEVKDADTLIEEFCDNVDRQGTALSPFIMEVSKQAFQDGVSYVIVDMPDKNGAETLAQEKQLGIRPYLSHIVPGSVLELLSKTIDGTETLIRARFVETVIEEVPGTWDYKTYERVKVLIREDAQDERGNTKPVVRWEVYEEQGNGNAKAWVKTDEGMTTFSKIMVYAFYTNRTGFMVGEPPFQDIAESNVEHFQWKSEHGFALSMCCFGMYTATGVPTQGEDKFQFNVGPAKTLTTANPNAKFGVLETSGKGVTLASEYIKQVESRIKSARVFLRVENAGQVTATAAAIDSEDTNASLKAIAKGYSDTIELILQDIAELVGSGTTKTGDVRVNDEFGVKHGTTQGLAEVTKARSIGDLSRRSYLGVLQWRGELPGDFDMDRNDEEISSEGMNGNASEN